ncbi:MAG: hypothetical protein RL208_523 [Pseudomonadota bacterium]|jgi:hypothetical protein
MLFRIFLSFLAVVLISGLSLLTGAKYSCKIGAYLKQNFCKNCAVEQVEKPITQEQEKQNETNESKMQEENNNQNEPQNDAQDVVKK